MTNPEERMRILQMIEDGQITADEGMRRLSAEEPAGLPPAAAPEPPPDTSSQARPGPEDKILPPRERPKREIPRMEGWRRFWLIPLWIGAAFSVVGGLLMGWAYAATHAFGGWFVLATLPFVLGVIIMALAASSRNARWLHLRVRSNKPGGHANIAISLPLPLRLTAWLLRVFGPFIPKLKDTSADEMIMALDETTSAENPFYVEVDDDEDGEHVEVYFG